MKEKLQKINEIFQEFRELEVKFTIRESRCQLMLVSHLMSVQIKSLQ